MFQGSQFRDYNQRHVKSLLLTTCLRRQNHLWRQAKGPASYAKLHLLPPAQQKQLSKAPLMSAIAKRAIPTSRIQPLEQKGWTPNTSVKLPELIVRMQCSSGFKTSQQIEPSSNMSHGSSETEPPIARIKVTPFILTKFLYKITIFGFLYKCHLTVFR